jgi:predicted O-methyltransferase YrrM
MFEVLDDYLPSAVKMFRRCYDPASGGYHVPFSRDIKSPFTFHNIMALRRECDEPVYDSVEVPVADLLFNLCRNSRAVRILETGTSRGFSTCHLAAAVGDVPEGFVLTIDPFPGACFLWEGAEIAQKITHYKLHLAEAAPLCIARLEGGKFDFMFFDSLHTYDHLATEIMCFEPYLRVGGLIALHDTMFYDQLGYLAHDLKACPRFEVINIPSERLHQHKTRCPGVTVIRKISEARAGEKLQLPHFGQFAANSESPEIANVGRTHPSQALLDILTSRQ